jgi:hypothetical protein
VIDIRKLYGATEAFTYDPGFTSTAACESALTFIDGDVGTLLHRGYPIDQLASKSNFIEVCHLLLHGELPTASEYEAFERSITMHTMLHSQFDRFFEGFRRDAHPMAIMVGTVGALSAFYHDSLDIHDPVQRNISAIRLIAKMPTLAARAYKYHVGQPFVSPRNDLTYAAPPGSRAGGRPTRCRGSAGCWASAAAARPGPPASAWRQPRGDVRQGGRLQRAEAAQREERHIGDPVLRPGRRSGRRRRGGPGCTGSARRRSRRCRLPSATWVAVTLLRPMWRTRPWRWRPASTLERLGDRALGRAVDVEHDPQVDDVQRLEAQIAQVVVHRALQLVGAVGRVPRGVVAARAPILVTITRSSG